MSSAADAKPGALYINTREAIPMQWLLKEMGRKQPPTPIQTNNSTAHGVVTNNIQPQRTKAMDMRFQQFVIIQIVLNQFVIKLIQIRYIQIHYNQFLVKPDM